MKKICILFLSLNFIFFFGQKFDFQPTIKVIYNASLQLGEKYLQRDQKFVLVGNSQDYYFAGYNNYLKDTDQDEKIKKSGINFSAADYIDERILKKNGITNVYGNYIDERLRYDESVSIQWVLYNETKIINGIKCQMAATNKYGRRWIAYFSKEYPQSLGPYKFTGLPGLIFELYDIRNDYHFTVVKLEKNTNDFEFNLKGYKKLSKKDFLKATYNLKYTLAGYSDMGEELRKEMQNAFDKLKKMNNNPLELKPFE
jgi:GLPGLI family protein